MGGLRTRSEKTSMKQEEKYHVIQEARSPDGMHTALLVGSWSFFGDGGRTSLVMERNSPLARLLANHPTLRSLIGARKIHDLHVSVGRGAAVYCDPQYFLRNERLEVDNEKAVVSYDMVPSWKGLGTESLRHEFYFGGEIGLSSKVDKPSLHTNL